MSHSRHVACGPICLPRMGPGARVIYLHQKHLNGVFYRVNNCFRRPQMNTQYACKGFRLFLLVKTCAVLNINILKASQHLFDSQLAEKSNCRTRVQYVQGAILISFLRLTPCRFIRGKTVSFRNLNMGQTADKILHPVEPHHELCVCHPPAPREVYNSVHHHKCQTESTYISVYIFRGS